MKPFYRTLNKLTTERIILLILSVCVIWYFYWPFFPNPQEIQLYYRASGSNNYWESSFDYLKITNYTNRSVTAKQLYQYAQHYVDTVEADYNVSNVTFVGQTPGGSLPNDIAEDMFDQVRSQSLISFSFSNAFPQPPDAEKKLIGVDIYEDGNYFSYDNRLEKDKKAVHDIISSDKPFDNGFTGRNRFVSVALVVILGIVLFAGYLRAPAREH